MKPDPAIFADFDRRYSQRGSTEDRLQAAMDQFYENGEEFAAALKARDGRSGVNQERVMSKAGERLIEAAKEVAAIAKGEMEPGRVTVYGGGMEPDHADLDPPARHAGADDGITPEMINQGVAILENAGFASDSFFTREIVREILRLRDCRS